MPAVHAGILFAFDVLVLGRAFYFKFRDLPALFFNIVDYEKTKTKAH